MPIKRLKEATGTIDQKGDSGSEEELIRPCILVHSGPEGEGLTFMSMDGETRPFDAERIKTIVDNQNKLLDALGEQYGGWENIPQGAFPPLLDGHDNESAHNVLGRMVSKLRVEVRDVPKVGKNVVCAVTDIKFLGRDNVTKAKDGRVYHLSVGIDEEADTLGETSAVVDPAAPGAMLLAKGKKTSEGVIEMPTPNKDFAKRLTAHKNKMSKLAAIKADLETGNTRLVQAKEATRLAKAQGEIGGTLTRLMKERKLTPAEVKNIDVKSLAALPKEHLDTIIKSYEALEPKIQLGQRGSSDTVEVGDIAKEVGKRKELRLRAQTKAEMIKMGAKVKMSKEEEEALEDKHMSDAAQDTHRASKKMSDAAQDNHRAAAEKEHMDKMKSHLSTLAKCLEEGKHEDAKKEMAALSSHCEMGAGMKHMSGVDDVKSEDYKMSMEHLEGELDEVKTNLARMAGMISELMSAESEEGHDLESAANEVQPGVKA